MVYGVLLGLALLASTAYASLRTNRYAHIVARNVFGLRPPPPAPPPPAPPLPKLTLTGITTLVASQALLKIQFPAHPGAAARQEECILKVGESCGPVRLLEINASAGSVKVDNSGTVMEVGFQAGTAPAAGPAPRFRLAAH